MAGPKSGRAASCEPARPPPRLGFPGAFASRPRASDRGSWAPNGGDFLLVAQDLEVHYIEPLPRSELAQRSSRHVGPRDAVSRRLDGPVRALSDSIDRLFATVINADVD